MALIPTPVIPSIDPLQALASGLIQYITAKDILGQSGVPAQLARAKAIAGFTEALEEINTGSASGVADLQTALANLVATIKDPAAQIIVNELLATFAAQLSAVEGTLIGKLEGATGGLILSQIDAVATYYVQQLSAAPAAARK